MILVISILLVSAFLLVVFAQVILGVFEFGLTMVFATLMLLFRSRALGLLLLALIVAGGVLLVALFARA
jgi:hypothetical protein